MTSVLLIAPSFKEPGNGIAGYVHHVGKRLEEMNMKVFYLDADDLKKFRDDLLSNLTEPFIGYCLENNIQTLILNYSGYGYQKKGMPFWLADLIKGVRIKTNIFVITFFHELYASGPFFSLSFWTHKFQKHIFRKILSASHKVICSNQRVASLIQKEDIIAESNIYKMPIFSNIGEPIIDKLSQNRNNQMVVFGTLGLREKVYQSKFFFDYINFLAIERVIDIGSGNISIPDSSDIRLDKCGFLSDNEISELLLISKWAAISYPCTLLAKSGVFAAYAAHACCVVNFDSDHDEHIYDGLKSELHYVTPKTLLNQEIATSISLRLYDWYQEHNIEKHIVLFSKLFK